MRQASRAGACIARPGRSQSPARRDRVVRGFLFGRGEGGEREGAKARRRGRMMWEATEIPRRTEANLYCGAISSRRVIYDVRSFPTTKLRRDQSKSGTAPE